MTDSSMYQERVVSGVTDGVQKGWVLLLRKSIVTMLGRYPGVIV